RNIT
ncbi:Bifunctional uridylyltransferase/uridylyl-removing enzyme, partial [Haemophilus influenzae]